jgi:hypothetical protein
MQVPFSGKQRRSVPTVANLEKEGSRYIRESEERKNGVGISKGQLVETWNAGLY